MATPEEIRSQLMAQGQQRQQMMVAQADAARQAVVEEANRAYQQQDAALRNDYNNRFGTANAMSRSEYDALSAQLEAQFNAALAQATQQRSAVEQQALDTLNSAGDYAEQVYQNILSGTVSPTQQFTLPQTLAAPIPREVDTRTPAERLAADMATLQQGQAVMEEMRNLPAIPAQQAPVSQQPGPALLSTLTPTTGPQATGMQPTSPQGQSFLTGTQPTGTNMVTPLNPDTLPALRGAAAGSSSIDPTLRPYLELGLRGAEQLFLQQQPSLFPGRMFVGPSEQTQAALNMQEDIALAQPTTLQAAQESFMRGLGGIGATAGGAFLMGSPFRQQMIESATRPLMQQFEETTLPGVSSLYSRAGRYGSGAMDRAVGQATEATGRAIGDVASNIAFQDYSAERQRQQQALGLQLQGATLAPQIYGQQFLPSQQLAQVGAAREAIAAQPLQEDIQRFQFQQQIPYQQLQGFLSSVYGTPLAGSQYQPPAQTNRAGSALGGAALGAGIGQMIGGGFGGFSAPTIGAALGGLGGLLF